ncbi:hypothetical protein ACQJBY_055929 [Aegilops geniculata]
MSDHEHSMKTSSSHHRGKTLKPGVRGLLRAIVRAMKTRKHVVRSSSPLRNAFLISSLDRDQRRTEATIRSVRTGVSKSLIVIRTMLLLKAITHNMSFVTPKRTIRVSPNLVDPPSDGTNTRRNIYNIPRADALKSSSLFCHQKVPFGMNNITIRSWLKNNSANAWKT